MDKKDHRPYKSKAEAFAVMVKQGLFNEKKRAKERLAATVSHIEDLVRQKHMTDDGSEEYIELQQEIDIQLASKERMEIALVVWEKAMQIYADAEDAYNKFYIIRRTT